MTLRQPPNPDLALTRTYLAEVACPDCGGDGEILYREFDGSETGVECSERCDACDGSGTVRRERQIPWGDSE